MIRVLEVLATLKRAGAETMVASLVRGLDRTRFQPMVVSLFDPFPGGLEPEIDAPMAHLGKRRGFDPRMWIRLRTVARNFRPHIVHTHSYVMRYALPAVAQCAMVHTVHNLALREVDTIGRAVHRAGFRVGVVPVAVADEVARSFASVYGFAPEVIPNGIDTARFVPRVHRAGERVRVVSVARLEPQKNPRMLVDALPENCDLLLAGDGSLRGELEGLPRVQLLGVQSDVAALLATADIFALGSEWEGHPLAVIEAMAAGLPVVATAVGGVPGVLGDAGILTPAGDVEAMRRALKELAASPAERAMLGARARARAMMHFDVKRMVASYSAMFERVARR